MDKGKSILVMAGGLLACSLLAGCVGGTTYGTGEAQEKATVDDLVNILALRKKRTATIDYDPRPDLVVPEDKQLVEPAQKTAADDQQWPETPEDRIARIRDEAESVRGNVIEELGLAMEHVVEARPRIPLFQRPKEIVALIRARFAAKPQPEPKPQAPGDDKPAEGPKAD